MKRPDLFGYVGAVCPAPGVSPGLIAKSDFQYTDESPYLLLLTAGSNDTVVYSTPVSYTHLTKDDDFTYSSNKLDLEWQWNHNPDNTAWSVTERPGYLRLKNNTLATNLLDAKNTLTQRAEGRCV